MNLIATYKDRHGYTVKGLLVDDKLHRSVTGNLFVFIDNFANRVLIEDVININYCKVA